MPGGNWSAQNKVRPGVYINFNSKKEKGLTIGERGTVAICEPMSWGPVGKITEVVAGEDTTPVCGYPVYATQARFLNEIFKGSDRTAGPSKILLYRPAASDAAAATATLGSLTATAIYNGTRGNDITVVIVADPDTVGTFTVQTIVDGVVVDSQTGKTVADLSSNSWVGFTGTGALVANAGVALTGGADGTVTAAAYSTFLTALEPYRFDILIYDGSDTTTIAAFQNFVKRMWANEGKYCQLVAAGQTDPDSWQIINVKNGVILNDGTTLTPQQTCWWVGGAQAGAKYNESLTYAKYPAAVDVSPKLTNSQTIAALQAGELVMTADNGAVKVEWDIDSFKTYTDQYIEAYHKNRVIRLLSTIANDVYTQFSNEFIGVVNNNEAGRLLFKSVIVGYLLDIQSNQGIQNFTAEDVEVLPGESIDSIVINIGVTPTDSVEKIYMTITVS